MFVFALIFIVAGFILTKDSMSEWGIHSREGWGIALLMLSSYLCGIVRGRGKRG